MAQLDTREKLAILADAAKYDASCASSGTSKRDSRGGKGVGSTEGMGICHSYTEDGRCVSLLKILLTNHCIFDCAYCVSRRSNDVKRAAFTVDEVVDLTINFYRRNYIEGLFLSSGIFSSPDYTMERLVRIVKKLRTEHKFNGYIHVKTIPGASEELIAEAGLYADRLSVNIELPSELALQTLAPEKNYAEILTPMGQIRDGIIQNKEEKALFKKVPAFATAGQSTQLIVGASGETDLQIIKLSDSLYQGYGLKRVYYSGYIPVTDDARLPQLAQGDPVTANDLTADGHQTSPPPRFTEASLIKALEERGIGRPSTYAATISVIQDRGYVSNRGQALVPSWLAFAVTRLLEENFHWLVDYDFTASMEEDLDAIAAGDKNRVEWLTRFYFGDADGAGAGEIEGLSHAVENLGEIDAREVNSIDIGDGITVRGRGRGGGPQAGRRSRGARPRRAHGRQGARAARYAGRG